MIRPVLPTELPEIERLLNAAFAPGKYESKLVRKLNANGRELHQWVLEADSRIAAYICYSRAYQVRDVIGWHLAPLAVHPDYQGRGLGSRLVEGTLGAEELGAQPVFVLGEPAYYSRFGFGVTDRLICPFDPGGGHFAALRWDPEVSDVFQVGYEPEFFEEEE